MSRTFGSTRRTSFEMSSDIASAIDGYIDVCGPDDLKSPGMCVVIDRQYGVSVAKEGFYKEAILSVPFASLDLDPLQVSLGGIARHRHIDVATLVVMRHLEQLAPAEETGSIASEPKKQTLDSASGWKRYAIFAHCLSLVLAGTLIQMFDRAPNPSWEGISVWLLSGFGFFCATCVFGGLASFVGNKWVSFMVGTALALGLMIVGLVND